jgi:RNA polymerase sigma-70 factor, ECF subfamily
MIYRERATAIIGLMNDRPLAHLDDDALLARIHAGDRAACDECIQRHASDVYHLALRLLQNEADAEDVTQETFLSAFEAIAGFEGRAALKTWLYRIAYNSAMMRLRKHAPPRPQTVSLKLHLPEEGQVVPRQFFDWCCLPESDYENTELRAHLEQAIRTLPDTLRGVFILRDMHELSTAETAETLDVSTDVVKTRLRRARLALRDQLSPHFPSLHQAS